MKEEDLEKIKQRKHTLSELCIDLGDGQAVITKEDLIEFHDCLPISIQELEYVLGEAKNFISFRNFRIFDKLFTEFPEIPETPHVSAKIALKSMDQLIAEFPDNPHISHLVELIEDAQASRSEVKLVSTWDIKCGIATYTKYLYDAIKQTDSQFPLSVHPISKGIDNVQGKILHFQHEYGIIPRAPRNRCKSIITFHTVFKDIAPTLAQYEKNLNVVAYVAHFQEAYDIISANTKKDVWMIPHGSKIMTGANGVLLPVPDSAPDISGSDSAELMKSYVRCLLDVPLDELHAFMFGFQSGNKDYELVTQACEKAGIKLIISGAVNDHADPIKNMVSGQNVTVLNRFLSETEVDMYALASDILIVHAKQLEHYSCSGALHRVIGAGRPVICNRANHYMDIIEDEDCLKYDTGEELEQKIAEALEKKEEFGRKALEYAERTSWEIVAKKHIEIYKKYGGF